MSIFETHTESEVILTLLIIYSGLNVIRIPQGEITRTYFMLWTDLVFHELMSRAPRATAREGFGPHQRLHARLRVPALLRQKRLGRELGDEGELRSCLHLK